MGKTKGKEKESIALNEALALNDCILSLLEGENKLTGGVSYALVKNAKKLSKSVSKVQSGRKDILDKYIVKENGVPVMTEVTEENQTPSFTYADGDEEKCAKEIKELLRSDFEIDIHRIKLDKFDECMINTNGVRNLDLFMDLLIQE